MFQPSSQPSERYDFTPELQTFRQEVLAGLSKSQKELPCKYFYDETGSQLFDQICELAEYYPTRTEITIMHAHIHEIVETLGDDCMLIEYGSGSSLKTRLLLDHLPSLVAYVPIDIARTHLHDAVARLACTYPDLEILPVCADYTRAFTLPMPTRPATRRIAYYPGSTIGNFEPGAARRLLRQIAQTCSGGGLLVGVDLKKDFATLHRAYNDQQGVTERFNLHLLERINHELDANFDVPHFGHYAFYNPGQGRIEMHLVSNIRQQIQLGENEIMFARGESIWTESSYKYSLDEFALLAADAGFKVEHVWTDPQELFSIQYLSTT